MPKLYGIIITSSALPAPAFFGHTYGATPYMVNSKEQAELKAAETRIACRNLESHPKFHVATIEWDETK